jgi:hypothetical protein
MNSSDELLGRPGTINVQLEFFWKSDIARYAEFFRCQKEATGKTFASMVYTFSTKSLLECFDTVFEEE